MSIQPTAACSKMLLASSPTKPSKGKPPLKLDLPMNLMHSQKEPSLEEKTYTILHPVVVPEHEAWMHKSLGECKKPLEYLGEGLSGSYIVLTKQTALAILKPLEGNPLFHGTANPVIFDGILPETMGLREVLAYQLFSQIVPPTALVRVFSENFFEGEKTKTASMQKFISDGSCASQLSKEVLQKNTHFLSETMVMDLCLYNLDRNPGNFLFRTNGEEIFDGVPIDHGCILPNNCSSGVRFFWLSLIDRESHFGTKELETIRKLEIDSSIQKIKRVGLSDGAVNTFLVNTLLVKLLAPRSSIYEIAMYQLQHDQNLETQHSIVHYILRWALFKQKIAINPHDNDSVMVNPSVLEPLLIETIDFVDQLKKEALSLCQTYGIPEEKFYFMEGDSKDFLPHEPIHIVYRAVRYAMFVCFLNNSMEKMENGSWRQTALDQLPKLLGLPL
jgi:hypothetical protein